MDHKLRPLGPEIKVYINDTNDFLRKLGEVSDLPDDVILCTIDVVGLYPHILHNEGLDAIKEALYNSCRSQEEGWKGSLNEDEVAIAELVLKGNDR